MYEEEAIWYTRCKNKKSIIKESPNHTRKRKKNEYGHQHSLYPWKVIWTSWDRIHPVIESPHIPEPPYSRKYNHREYDIDDDMGLDFVILEPRDDSRSDDTTEKV
jgi:hypothetical protein